MRMLPSINLLFCCAAVAFAGDNTTRGVLNWKCGPQATHQQNSATLAHNLGATKHTGQFHQVIQLQRLPTPADRRQLAAAGVHLLSYLGNNAFFTTIDHHASAAMLEAAPIRCVLPIAPASKLHSTFISGDIPLWAQTPTTSSDDRPAVVAFVLFHSDISLAPDAIEACQRHGAHIRSVLRSINGLLVELPADNLIDLAHEDSVQWIEPPIPRMGELNDDCRTRTAADIIADPPYELDGTGVTVLVYDSGHALASHQDFGGRLSIRDDSPLTSHATHVAGTIGGDGTSSGETYQGMAPAVTLESYGFQMEGGLQPGFLYTDPGDIEDDYYEAINSYGANLANNSIGTYTAANGFPCEWEGNYGATSVLIDTIVRGDGDNPLFTTPFRVVWANGNERQSGRCGATYNTTAPPACAKNHITVGALYSDNDSVTPVTSWGPTDDGRLKPDIAAPGSQIEGDQGVTSCSIYGGYSVMSGTSSAAAVVTGIGALLLQDFRTLHPTAPDFRNSTLKALLAHTAHDAMLPGPDYQTGYGSVRAQAAVDLLRSDSFRESTIVADETYTLTVTVTPADLELRVTVAWDDVPGTPNVSPVLVNDLDLAVYDSEEAQYFPWTLDPANPHVSAVRDQPDHLNNVEQVVIDAPSPGVYRIEVSGFNVPSGPQPFSICVTPELATCSSSGTLTLDRAYYACQSRASLHVLDCDLNTDDQIVESVTVVMASDSEPAGETILLTETSADSADFAGQVALETADDVGILLVAPGDDLTAAYIDSDDGQGGLNVEVLAYASVDCLAPQITNVQASNSGSSNSTVTLETNEPARAIVHYGLACDSLAESQSGVSFTTTHAVELTGLVGDTTYYFTVEAADQAGNLTTDDAGGDCYTFTTMPQPNYFTELFEGNLDLENMSLTFEWDSENADYSVCANLIADLPTDPTGGAPLTLTEDGFQLVTLADANVLLYGQSYGSFYIGSNGYITFTAGDGDPTESLTDHFSLPRVSAEFNDFSPQSGGIVSWQQLDDRAVVTWLDVPEYSLGGSNTFQIEMHFDGTLTISYLDLSATDGLVGLSAGNGIPSDYTATDLSAANCGPRPPVAFDQSTGVYTPAPVSVQLVAVDDGLPDPPNITYIIDSLPEYELLDAGDSHLITADDIPYTLVDAGDQVTYRRFRVSPREDSFDFHADDGGESPTGGESNTATVTLTIGTTQPYHVFHLDSDPGWATEGLWAFGQPTGDGSHNGDPTSGYTGTNVYGYNLAGDYVNDMDRYYLTTTALDCTDVTNAELRFWRRLGVEDANFDHAGIEISSDGENWTAVWEHGGGTITDAFWIAAAYNISAAADGQETVYIRWAMGATDDLVTYPGWNIDDIEIWRLSPAWLGDLNCDEAVNFDDIDPFVLALASPAAYYAAYPDCSYWTADADDDGDVDFDDIDAFVALLVAQ